MTPRAGGCPPRLADWLLRRWLPPGDATDTIRGDLVEEFRLQGDTASARRWYWRQALSVLVRFGWRRMPRRRHHMFWDSLRQDVRYAIRAYAKTPSFTLAVVTTLALGIGASTAIFSMVNGILLRPLPFLEPDRLLWINEVNPNGNVMSVSWPNFLDWRARVHSFETLAASRTSQFTLTGMGQARRISGRRVTGDFFGALGTRPAIGRGFTPDDDRPGAELVAIVSDAFWRQQLGADRAAVGRALVLDGRPFTVVGVLPRGFRYLRDYDAFVAMGAFANDPILLERGNHAGYYALGRLRPGVTPDAAARELEAVEAQVGREHPDVASGVGVHVEPLASRLVTTVRQTLLVLLGAVGFLLLIACANVANLLIARGAARQHELAVRAALGGGRLRLARQLLAESTLVSGVGGLLGVALASALLRVLVAVAPEGTPRIDEVRLDGPTLLFAAAAAAACGIIFGAFPAFQASSASGQRVVVRSRSTGAAAASHRLRRALIVVEVALALVLLTGAGLMVRTLQRLGAVELGFRPDHLMTAQIAFRGDRWDDARRVTFVDELLQRARALPGAESAAAVAYLPIDGSNWNSVFAVEGRPSPSNRADLPSAAMTPATPTYFQTMGMRRLRGRTIDEHDRPSSTPVIVVNESLARRLFPGEDPIGRRIKQGWPESPGAWRTIVGIVGDVKVDGLVDPTPMQIYLPFAQVPDNEAALVIRTAADPASLEAPLRALIGQLDRDLPVYSMRTMDGVLEGSIARERMSVLILGVFAGVALLLASIGLYGTIAHGVTERTHEIGVRLALGAAERQILSLIVRQGVAMATIGTAIGVAGVLALSRGLEGLLFQVQPTDPLTLAAVSLLLFGVALVACYVPARRAARVDPTTALRAE